MTREEVRDYILTNFTTMAKDWDTGEEVRPESLIFTELGFESLDAVILGVAIQEHFGRQMPFAELLAQLGQSQKDLSVNELIDFVYSSLNQPASGAQPSSVTPEASH